MITGTARRPKHPQVNNTSVNRRVPHAGESREGIVNFGFGAHFERRNTAVTGNNNGGVATGKPPEDDAFLNSRDCRRLNWSKIVLPRVPNQSSGP
jgi:hypothetical protein